MVNSFSPFWSDLVLPSSEKPKLGFADGDDPRIQHAIKRLSQMGFCQPLLVDEIKSDIPTLTSRIKEKEPDYFEKHIRDSLYQGVGQLLEGHIDGLLAGSLRPTADVVKAAIRYIGSQKGQKLISGQFLVESKHRKSMNNSPFLFSDCAVIPEPSPRALSQIAIGAAESYRFFVKKEPKIALLSFSTRGSAEHPLVDKIREAVTIIRKHDKSLLVDGEIQLDAAIDGDVAKIKKATDSKVSPEANVFIFPSLESGNIGYKLVQRFSEARIAGPLLWGLKKPVSDLSRGCTIQEIIDSAACVAKMVKGQK